MAVRKRSANLQLLRALYFNRNGILFLVMALVSIGLLALSARTHGTASQFWLGLGAATIATTGYSFLQVMLTTSQFNNYLTSAIETNVQQALKDGTKQALDTFRTMQADYLPTSTYPPLNATNPRFNRDLNEAMSSSGRYIFRGMSARYAIARLALLSRPPRDIALIVANPTKPAAVDSRARHDATDGTDEAFDLARQRIIDGIYMAIAGAYLTRRKYEHIEFGFTPIPHVDRVELCDSAVFISRFSEDRDGRAVFPSTLRFGRDSLIYQMFYRDCNSVLTSPYVSHLELPGDLSEEDFLAKLDLVSCERGSFTGPGTPD